MKQSHKYYKKEIVKMLQNNKRVAVFGARIVAIEVASCLMGKPYNLEIPYFVVSRTEDNPSEFMGRPVISVEQARERLPSDTWIVIASMEKNLGSIIECLHESNFYNLLPLTFESDLWSYIRGNYFMEYCYENQKEYFTLEGTLTGAEFEEKNI